MRSIENSEIFFLFNLLLALLRNVNGVKEMLRKSEIDEEKLSKGYPRDALSNFTQFTSSYGYVSEEHTVRTEDGYILSVFRIPKGKNCQGPVRQPPVLLMHGLLQSSDSWLDAGPSAGLAFLISDACYDLWVGNVRGTNYGRRNVDLDADKDTEFWNFSTDEMGKFDLPATIDYLLNTTGSDDLIYVGFSQGGRILFIMCSETTGYCDKIKISILLSPAVRVKYYRSIIIKLVIEFYYTIAPLLKSYPLKLEFAQKGGLLQELASLICKEYLAAATFCNTFLTLLDADDPASFLIQTVRVLYGHFPTGTSTLNLALYGQNILEDRFQKYDYGTSENLKLYGSVQPTLYNFNRTKIPIVLTYGQNDYLIDPKDVIWLSNQLPNVVETYEVKHPFWTHFDNCYSQWTKQFIFPKINEYLLKYSKIGSVSE